MALVMRIRLPSSRLPSLQELRQEAEGRLDLEVVLEEDAQRLEGSGRRESSWSPWPRSRVSFFVPSASTRGVDISLQPSGEAVDAQVSAAVLCSWTDQVLAVALARALAERGDGGVSVPGEGRFLGEGLHDLFVASEARYLSEAVAGCERVKRSVEAGRTVRIGGPAGFASVGPRAWEALQVGPEAELPLRLIDAVQASIEARGYEDFYPANILCLDGREGREILASVLPPARDTLLRDPEYVLLSPDLEGEGDVPLLVLPFEQIDDALPALPRWIDDRTCAVPAIPKSAWPARIEAMRPLLIPLGELLDGPGAPAPPQPRSRSRWWRRGV